jgi:hypothetical protein
MTNFAVLNTALENLVEGQETGTVVNLIVADTKQTAQEVTGSVCIEFSPVLIGSTYADGVFTPPAE